MTTQTVPQDVYQRHEREWQMLREAIAKSQKKTNEPAMKFRKTGTQIGLQKTSINDRLNAAQLPLPSTRQGQSAENARRSAPGLQARRS